MKGRIDVMVDIETLGTKSDSTIIQISAIAFDIRTGTHLYTFNEIADITMNRYMKVDGSTIKWWLNTDKELLTTLINSGTHSSQEILHKFYVWLNNLSMDMKNVYLWGNGILFDNKMIQHQFESIGLDYPIFYRNDRDVRTILELASMASGLTEQYIKDMSKNENLVHHNALDDTIYQISLVRECFRILTEGETF